MTIPAISNLIIQLILAISVAFLFSALLPIRWICAMLPRGLARSTWRSMSVLIIFSAAGVAVFLRINTTEAPNPHDDWLVSLVFLAASIFVLTVCTLALHTAKDLSKIADLEHAAIIDPVTELFNRRHIMALLDAQCQHSSQHNSPFSILLIDVDNFKTINDTFGHRTGDTVLKELGRVIAHIIPDSRSIGRYGGEEFLVILPQSASSEAWRIAEELRAAVQSTKIASQRAPINSPTISIGIATAYGWKETSEDLIEIADQALYSAKAAGRNCVCHAFESSGRPLESKFTVVSAAQ
ncbi:GGDEF domain-containing protein [Tunturibacter empetritectus]|uniref:diguanylate cyclase n=1 Tax=Tunturiibacter empetritectus TaxID=3069691 RepID=A0A7W8IIG0_9BACT|nr:GGDEF domain-containing protein [Edaphobacter lichenicola]MBB5316748.1 diguanylate cyclase (GGDEF)-like protein [Edaphobacter lichenicola]